MALLLYSCISVHLCLLAPDLQWRWHMCIVGCGERAAAAEFPRSHSWCPVPGPRPIWDWKHFCLWGESEREREKYSVDWFEIYVVFFRGNPVIHFFVFGFHWTMMKKLGFYRRTTIFSLCACVCLFICMCVFVLSGLWYEGQCVGHALWTEHSIFREPRVWHQLREVGPTLLKSLSESQFLDFTNEKWIISLTDIKKL